MRRRSIIIIALCLVSMEWGCSSQSAKSKAEVESRLKEVLKLKEIRLTEGEPGKFEGTGTSENGSLLKIKATQSKSELRWEAEDSKGGKGSGGEGGSGSR